MTDQINDPEEVVDTPVVKTKKRVFRKFYYRGIGLDALVTMSHKEFEAIAPSRIRRRIQRGLDEKAFIFLNKIRKAKLQASAGEKPKLVKTHLRNMPVLPEMIGRGASNYEPHH